MTQIALMKPGRLVSGLLVALTGLLLSSFQTIEDLKKNLEGNWEAQWQIRTTPTSSLSSSDKMEGHMDFKKDGKVKIEAFGYPGCIFSNDTIQNQLLWAIRNDSLLLYNQKDHFSLSYSIQRSSENEILLQLMEDIFITLKKR